MSDLQHSFARRGAATAIPTSRSKNSSRMSEMQHRFRREETDVANPTSARSQHPRGPVGANPPFSALAGCPPATNPPFSALFRRSFRQTRCLPHFWTLFEAENCCEWRVCQNGRPKTVANGGFVDEGSAGCRKCGNGSAGDKPVLQKRHPQLPNAPERRKCNARFSRRKPMLQKRHPRPKSGRRCRKCSTDSSGSKPLLQIRHPEPERSRRCRKCSIESQGQKIVVAFSTTSAAEKLGKPIAQHQKARARRGSRPSLLHSKRGRVARPAEPGKERNKGFSAVLEGAGAATLPCPQFKEYASPQLAIGVWHNSQVWRHNWPNGREIRRSYSGCTVKMNLRAAGDPRFLGQASLWNDLGAGLNC